MKKILWWSRGRHYPTNDQLAELSRALGDRIEFECVFGKIESAEEVANKFRSGRYDELVLIAPDSVFNVLFENYQIQALRPQMVKVDVDKKERADWVDKSSGKAFRFSRFRRWGKSPWEDL